MNQQHRSEVTRARLEQVALDLFSRNGYEATGVAEICAAAGMSKGAFYHHFPSKQAVFLSLLEDWLAGLDREMATAFVPGESVAEGLMRMAGMLRQVFEVAGGHLPMILEFWAQASRDPAVWQATIAPYRRYQNIFAAYIEQGVQDGSLRPVNAQIAARLIVASAVGLLFEGVMDPQAADWGETAVQSIQLLIQGLIRR